MTSPDLALTFNSRTGKCTDNSQGFGEQVFTNGPECISAIPRFLRLVFMMPETLPVVLYRLMPCSIVGIFDQ